MMNQISGFEIENGVLLKYTGRSDEVTVPDGVTEIISDTFGGCEALSEITLSDTVQRIGEKAFWGCKSLTKLHFPASLNSFEKDAFYLCKEFSEITVDEKNPVFCSVDGVVYTKDMKEVVYCPCEKDGKVVIPDGVTTGGAHIFDDCARLTGITVPESVTAFVQWIFYNGV